MELYKLTADKVSQSQDVLMITAGAVDKLNNLAEFIKSPMLLALWNFVYYKCGWIVAAIICK